MVISGALQMGTEGLKSSCGPVPGEQSQHKTPQLQLPSLLPNTNGTGGLSRQNTGVALAQKPNSPGFGDPYGAKHG